VGLRSDGEEAYASLSKLLHNSCLSMKATADRSQGWLREFESANPTKFPVRIPMMQAALGFVGVMLSRSVPVVEPILGPGAELHFETSAHLHKISDEIASWLEERERKIQWDRRVRDCVERYLASHGMLPSKVVAATKRLLKSGGGAPVTRRTLAIDVLEARMASRDRSDRAVYLEFCPCSLPVHNNQCAERIRQQVIQLKRLLKKYNIQVPLPAAPNRHRR